MHRLLILPLIAAFLVTVGCQQGPPHRIERHYDEETVETESRIDGGSYNSSPEKGDRRSSAPSSVEEHRSEPEIIIE